MASRLRCVSCAGVIGCTFDHTVRKHLSPGLVVDGVVECVLVMSRGGRWAGGYTAKETDKAVASVGGGVGVV